MKKLVLCLYAIRISVLSWANNAVFFASGNQLIPITETQNSVQKEILDITRKNSLIHVHGYGWTFGPVNRNNNAF